MSKFLVALMTILFFLSCKSPEARRPITAKSGSYIDISAERNKKLNEIEKKHILQALSKNPEADYMASQSGFWYYYNTKVENDTLPTPNFGDIVTFDYNVKTLNGDVIYSKQDTKTQRYPMDQAELFTGLREGLKLMKEGETVTFFFPSQKSYGYYGDHNKIGTNTPLVCEVTVQSITKNKVN